MRAFNSDLFAAGQTDGYEHGIESLVEESGHRFGGRQAGPRFDFDTKIANRPKTRTMNMIRNSAQIL
jgi:hypothetical protein